MRLKCIQFYLNVIKENHFLFFSSKPDFENINTKMINESSVNFKTKFGLAVAAWARHTPPLLVHVGDIYIILGW